MKRLFTLLLWGGATCALAQQVNGEFDAAWKNCTPWDSKGNTQTVDTQPTDWIISNVCGIGGLGATTVGPQVTESENPTDYSVKLTNTPNPFMSSQIVPAYLSLGTTWATAKAGLFSVSAADGGAFGGIGFTYRPDAVRLSYKRSHGTKNATERASVIAYLWKGTYTQSKVPGNTAMGTPTTTDMADRDRNILGKETSTGGSVTHTADAECIATVESYIEGDQSEWKELTVPFTYTSDAQPEKLNIIIAANDYFADRSKIGTGNVICVDHVSLVYYSELAGLSYRGISLLTKGRNAYNLSNETYDATLLSCKANGKGATIEQNYNPSTAVLTLTVKGNDIATNPANRHVYTVQFKKKAAYSGEISSISYQGTPLPDFEKGTNHYYRVTGEYAEGCITATAEDDELEAAVSYDAASRIATVSVPESGKSISYYIKFAEAAAAHDSKILISMAGQFLSAPAQTVGITDIKDGKVDLQLTDFAILGSTMGDIYVHDIPVASDGSLSKTDTIQIFGEAGSTLGEVPLTLSGSLDHNELNCALDISWNGIPIRVNVYPLNCTSIDATHISDLDVTAVKDGLTNPNVLLYADAGISASGIANVIVGTTCDSLYLSDEADLSIPLPFTATRVRLERSFKAGWNTVCLPFDCTPEELHAVQAQELAESNDETLSFTRVETMKANIPYQVYFGNGTSHTTLQDITTADTDLTTVTQGNISFTGNYRGKMGMTGYYGFVNENSTLMKGGDDSYIQATRAYFTSNGAQVNALKIRLDGGTTGISAIKTDDAPRTFDVYTLNGIRIRRNVTDTHDLPKGIYIINGKKSIIK